MIRVTKFDGEEMVINAELIVDLRATPDTVISLTTGKKILVMDEIDEIIDKVIEYKQKINVIRGVE